MSASIWAPGGTIDVNAESSNLEQSFITSLGQATYNLTYFTYVPNSNSVAVYRNGQRLVKGVDWNEGSSGTLFTLVPAVATTIIAGESIVAVAVIGSTSANAQAAANSATASANSANSAAGSALLAQQAAANLPNATTGGPNTIPVTDPTGTFWLYKTIGQLATWLGFGTAANYNVGTGANNVVQLDSSAKLPSVDGSALVALTTYSNKNLLINGDFSIDQRNNGGAQTVVAGAALAYSVDRWWVACTGANTMVQRVLDSAPFMYRLAIPGATGLTSFSFGQRIKATNSRRFVGNTCTLSLNVALTQLNSISWAVYAANSLDSFGTLASPDKTLIASGNWTGTTGSYQQYSSQITIPGTAANGLEVVFTVGALTTGGLNVSGAQLELGTKVTNFEFLPESVKLAECLHYYELQWDSLMSCTAGAGAGTNWPYVTVNFQVPKRVAPTISFANTVYNNCSSILANSIGTRSFNIAAKGSGNVSYLNTNWIADAEMKS